MKKLLAVAAALLGATGASAADLRLPVKAPLMTPAPVHSWSGFYAGLHAGGGWSSDTIATSNTVIFPPILLQPPVTAILTLIPGQVGTLTSTGSRSGAIGGIQAGYNWQLDRFVVGVEADIAGTGLRGGSASASRSFTGGLIINGSTVTQTTTVDFGHLQWLASFRGRLGLPVDRALLYVTGGAALAGIGGSTTSTSFSQNILIPAPGTYTASNGGATTRWGWTVGGGLEWAFRENWSVAGEYRHTDLGTRNVTFDVPDGLGGILATGTASGRLTVDQATARLNYRFGGGPFVR